MRRIKWLDEGVRVRIESEDDLWVLSQVCGSGCLVGMLSHRRDSTTGTKEDGRAKRGSRCGSFLKHQKPPSCHSQTI